MPSAVHPLGRQPPSGTAHPPPPRLLGRWVVAFTLGELVGFGLLPVLGGVVAARALADVAATPRAIALYAVAVVGGLGEGAVLAAAQTWVLREVLPGLDRRRWILHTAVAAALAWAAGMLVPTLDDLVGLGTAVRVVLWIPAGAFILVSIGGAQARLLAAHVGRPLRWLAANVVGWLLGLPFTFVVPALLPDDSPVAMFALALAAGGVLMGATAGLVTGLALRRMARDARDETVRRGTLAA